MAFSSGRIAFAERYSARTRPTVKNSLIKSLCPLKALLHSGALTDKNPVEVVLWSAAHLSGALQLPRRGEKLSSVSAILKVFV